MAYLGRRGALAPVSTADIPDNSITSAKIVDGAVAVADLGPNSVDSSELVDGSVDNSHLADDAVGTDELANDVIINTSGAITTTGAFTSVGIDDNASGAVAITIDSDEKVGIGTASPTAALVDIVGGVSGIVLKLGDNATNSTAKTAGISARHYTNAEEDIAMIACSASSASNGIDIGGGFGTHNAAKEVNFYTAANNTTTSGTNRMHIHSDGKVGIGTSSPDRILHIEGDNATGNSNPMLIRFTDNDTASAVDQIVGGLEFEGKDAAAAGIGSYIYGVAADTSGNQYLAFGTGESGSVAERMRITKEGNVGINVDPASTTRFYVDGIGTDSNTNNMVLRNGSNTNLLYVTDGGYTWAYQAWTTSDSRKKKNISYITEDILPKIENLKFAKFDMTETELKNCYGFIAQDVETIFPDCIDDTKPPGSDILYEDGDEIPEGKEIGDVKEEGEEQKNLNYNYLFSHLVKAVQELSAKVTALENA